jgi:hypothetical protein
MSPQAAEGAPPGGSLSAPKALARCTPGSALPRVRRGLGEPRRHRRSRNQLPGDSPARAARATRWGGFRAPSTQEFAGLNLLGVALTLGLAGALLDFAGGPGGTVTSPLRTRSNNSGSDLAQLGRRDGTVGPRAITETLPRDQGGGEPATIQHRF